MAYTSLALVFSFFGFAQSSIADTDSSSCTSNGMEQNRPTMGKFLINRATPEPTQKGEIDSSDAPGPTMGEPMPIQKEENKEDNSEMGLVAPPKAK